MSNPGETPLRGDHEWKPEQAAGFMDGSYTESTRDDPKRRVGNAQRKPWPLFDGVEKKRLTGQWVEERGRGYVFINQAGQHIEVLVAIVANGHVSSGAKGPEDAERLENRVYRFGGDLDEGTRYSIYLHAPDTPINDKSLQCGFLTVESSGRHLTVEFDFGGVLAQALAPDSIARLQQHLGKLQGARCERTGTGPNLLDRQLARTEIPARVRTTQWFPPTRQQDAALRRVLLDTKVRADDENYLLEGHGARPEWVRAFAYPELVQRYFAIQSKHSSLDALGSIESGRLTNIASALNELVRQAHSTAYVTPVEAGGIDSFQDDYFRLASLGALAGTPASVPGGTMRNLLMYTRAIIDGAPGRPRIDHFDRLLGIIPSREALEYDAEIEFVGAVSSPRSQSALESLLKKATTWGSKILRKLRNLPIGGIAGTLRVTTRLPPEDPRYFTATYWFVAGGVQVSKSVGDGGSATVSKGVGRSYGQAWTAENLEGPIMFLDVGAAAFGPASGKGASGTLLACSGGGADKPRESLGFDFSGLSDLVGAGAAASIGGSAFGGWMYLVSVGPREVEPKLGPDPEIMTYGVHSTVGPLHFPINGAGLSPQAMDLLEVFAASELAVLGVPGVEIEVRGYADQPGDKILNQILSRNRAITVYNYLKSILGDQLGTGELTAPQSEQVEVDRGVVTDVSNDQVRVVPYGEAAAEATHGQQDPQYDPDFRRVELEVNSRLRVTLRRKRDG